MAAKNNVMELEFVYERDTKMKQRFEEVVAKDAPEVCGKIYISKEACEKMGNPKKIHLRIEGES